MEPGSGDRQDPRPLLCPHCGSPLSLSADLCWTCGDWVPVGAHESLDTAVAPESR